MYPHPKDGAPRSSIMEEAGQKLKRVRERLGLTYRDVEDVSNRIATRHGNEEFTVALSRLSDIENKGTVPSIFRLYSLCAIYRLDLSEVLSWYGISLEELITDSHAVQHSKTHLVSFQPEDSGEVQAPALDPGLDLTKTTFLTRLIREWGRLPLLLVNNLDLKNYRYGLIGTDDWFMDPRIPPGSLVVVDDARRRIISSGWANEQSRPIYFLEHKEGYACAWCTEDEGQVILQPHPVSGCTPLIFNSDEIEIIGQVIRVAMTLCPVRRPRSGRS